VQLKLFSKYIHAAAAYIGSFELYLLPIIIYFCKENYVSCTFRKPRKSQRLYSLVFILFSLYQK